MKIYALIITLLFSSFSYAQNISNVTPNSGEQGTTSLPVTISGVNTNFDQATTTYIEFAQGSNTLSVLGVNAVTSNSIDLDLQIKNVDNTGYYDVNVYTLSPLGSQFATGTNTFQVIQSNLPPQIITSTPQTATLNQLLTVNISTSGTQFTQATSTTVWFSQGTSTINFPSTHNVLTDTSIVGNFLIDPVYANVGDVFDLNVYSEFDGWLTKPAALTITASTDISGVVYDPSNNPYDCSVELYQRIVSYNGLYSYVLHSRTNSVSGQYSFTNVPDDYYIIRAVPDDISGLSATYYNSATPGTQLWLEAESFSSSVSLSRDVYLVEASTELGTGSISGTLSSADGLVKSYFPIENARVICSSATNFYETLTDASGNYSLNNLPLDTYTVQVDIPGKSHLGSLGTIELSPTNETVTDNNYLVYHDDIIRSFLTIEQVDIVNPLKVYPVPARDHILVEFDYQPSSTINFSLFDINGRLINTINCSDRITKIDVQYLPSGKYFLSGIIDKKVFVTQVVRE